MTDHYEVDIQLLEDMLADIEEYAFLVNPEHDVVWVNKHLASRLGQEVANDNVRMTIGNNLLKDLCIKVLGNDYIIDLAAVKKTFASGRLSRHTHVYKNSTFKTFCMPIKGRESILYVLVLVEDFGNQDSNLATNILSTILDKERLPAFMTDSHGNVLVQNVAYKKAFKNSTALSELVLKQPQKSARNTLVKDINNLIGLKYKVEIKELKKEHAVQAIIYLLRKK